VTGGRPCQAWKITMKNEKRKVVLAADTHMLHGRVKWPEGDILVHAGDMTSYGSSGELEEFVGWLEQAPYERVVVIAGNHDRVFTRDNSRARKILESGKTTYLEDSGCEIDGIRFYGTPWTFNDAYDDEHWAFGQRSEPGLQKKWEMIPRDVDVLVTHSPPINILDRTWSKENVGSPSLLAEIAGRIKPRVHVFGHIHEAYGTAQRDGTTFVNACLCNQDYEPANNPVVVEI
jgi:Icc-related predicted phosphoesterase